MYKIGDKVKFKGGCVVYVVRASYGGHVILETRMSISHPVIHAYEHELTPYVKTYKVSKQTITPGMIAAEKKPTRKAALIMIKYQNFADDTPLSERAFEIVQDIVPYYAIEFFFDRVERMSQFYTA